MTDKRQKFIQLAEARVNRTINDIRLISNLSNRSAYEYGEDDICRVFEALKREVEVAEQRFRGSADRKTSGFTLGGR